MPGIEARRAGISNNRILVYGSGIRAIRVIRAKKKPATGPNMETSDKTFQILDALDRQEISNQRQLAEHAGVSLGQVNFILKSLLEKGLVKIGNFRRNPSKIGYMYLLTPKGIQTKSRLAVKFVMRKLEEYENLRDRLARRLALIEEMGHVRIAFVGPEMIKDFIHSVMRDHGLNMVLDGYYKDCAGLKSAVPGSFDIVLLFDGSSEGVARISETTGIPRDKLIPLW